MVVLDSNHKRLHVKWELHLYAPLVSKGQFLVVEDCYRRGHNKLLGPGLAINWYLKRSKNFVRTDYDKQFISTLTRGGWLLRK